MDEILVLLERDARLTTGDIAKLTGKSEAEVKKAVKKYEQDGVIVQYKAVINHDIARRSTTFVRALIEVGITPEKDAGFDRIAERIYKFPEVKSCYLVSGGYDLLVVVEGESIQTIADFVASKLSSMENVRQTATHFLLRKYKEDGQMLKKTQRTKRLTISY